jgi:hypothetical protein
MSIYQFFQVKSGRQESPESPAEPAPPGEAEPAEPAEPGTAGIEGLVEAESESKDGGRRGPRDLKGTSPMEPQNFQKA